MIALPPRPSENGVIVGEGFEPRPSIAATGIGDSIWAMSNWRKARRSRTLAQDTSLTRSSVRPSFCGKAEFGGGDQHRGIDQRNEAGAQRARPFAVSLAGAGAGQAPLPDVSIFVIIFTPMFLRIECRAAPVITSAARPRSRRSARSRTSSSSRSSPSGAAARRPPPRKGRASSSVCPWRAR